MLVDSLASRCTFVRLFIYLLLCSVACAAELEYASAQQAEAPLAAIQKFNAEAKPDLDRYDQTIRILVGSLPAAQAIQWLGPAIKTILGIDVTVTRVPYGDIEQSIMNDVTVAGNYDVLLFPPRMIGDLASDGHLVKLDDYAQKWSPDLDDVFPKFRNLYNYFGGHLYTLTMDGDRLELYYRTDLFDDPVERAAFKKQFGYDLQPPQTWDQYLDVGRFFTRKAGETLASKRLDGPFFGISEIIRPPDLADWWLCRFAAYGGVYFDENFRPQINTDAGLKATENLKAALAFGPSGFLNFGYSESYEAFMQGQTAMVIQWTGIAKDAEDPKSSRIAGSVGYAQIPGAKLPDGSIRHRSILAYGRVLGISTKSKAPEAAYKVIRFLNSPVVSELFVTGFGGLDPFRISHYADPSKWVVQWPKLPLFISNTQESLKNGYPELTIPGAVRYQYALAQQISRALAGEISSKDALVEIERQWNLITDELGGRDSQVEFWRDELKEWHKVGLAP